MSQRERHRDRITDEAALWFARAQDPDFSAADRKALADWLAGSAEHVREYLALAALAGEIGELEGTSSIAELIELASQSDDNANVVALSEGLDGVARGEDWSNVPVSRAGALDQQDSRGDLTQGSGHGSRTPLRKGGGLLQQAWSRRRLWAAAASVVLAIAAGAALYVQSMRPDVYVTALGEQRSVRLEDGTVVTLNAQSTIEVSFNEGRRDVRLLSGEVLFDVRKDSTRTFQVLAQGTVIRAIGTAFNVRHRGEHTTVTVVEGTVEVESAPEKSLGGKAGEVAESDAASQTAAVRVQPVRVTVGQQARIEAKSGQLAVIDTNVSKATAWRQRRLVFDAWPLSQVVAEFNLYNERPIVIDSDQLGQRAISGAFDADDRESFAMFLKEAGIAEARTRPDGMIELTRTAPLPRSP